MSRTSSAGSSGAPLDETRQNIPSLDTLRGVLSLVVVLAHGWQIFVNPVGQDGTLAGYTAGLLARIAVIFFFCLSGYVIAQSIGSNRQRNTGFSGAEYAWARIFRIVPPLLVVVALTYGFELILTALDANTVVSARAARQVFATDAPAQLVAIATLGLEGNLTGNWLNGPLWTLRYEIQLYALAGIAAVALYSSTGWVAWLARLALALVALLLVQTLAGVVLRAPHKPPDANQHQMLISFFSFTCGALAYAARGMPPAVLRSAFLLSALGVTSVCVFSPMTSPLEQMDTDIYWLAAQVLGAIGLGVAVAWVAKSGAFGFGHGLGKFSYTLYIAHFPALLFLYFLLHRFAPDLLAYGWLCMGVATAISFAALMRLGRHTEQPGRQRQALQRWLRPTA
jgi:peptidoglycan/LPS O-acetylase OafA/YrhL